MKKQLILVALLANILPLGAMNFDDLFGSMGDGGDPFGDMGDMFGGGDIGGMEDMFGGGDMDFASMFGGNDFDEMPGIKAPAKSKVQEKLPDVKTADEAFVQALPEKTKKLPKLFAQGLEDNLSRFASKLGTLSAHLSGFSLGITLREQLAPSANLVAQLHKAVDQVQTQSVYHRALYTKEFNSLRQRIANSFAELDKVIGAFVDIEKGQSNTLKKTSSRILRQQDGVFRKVEGLVKRTITPIEQDFAKILAHAQAKQRIEEKKRKYKERAQRFGNTTASAYGGWGSGASNYFNDGFDMGGFSGGWGDNGGGWDSMFGDDGDWGSGFGGGWGGNDWSSSDYSDYSSSYGGGSSHSSPSSSSPSSSSSRSYLAPVNTGSQVDLSSVAPSRLQELQGPMVYPQEQEFSEELPPAERLMRLVQQMTKKLQQRREKNEEDGVDKQKPETIRTMLEERSFTVDINRLVIIAKLMKDNEVQAAISQYEVLAQAVETFEKELKRCVPLLIDAAKYASPPFSTLIDEHALMAKEDMSRPQAIAKAKKLKKQRAASYKALMKWLFIIRKNEYSSLHQAIVVALQKQAAGVLEKLSKLIESNNNDEYIAYEDTEALMTFSRQLLQEPIVIGYSVVPDETEEQAENRKKKLDLLIIKKQRVEEDMNTLLQKKRLVLDAMRTTLQEAIEQVRSVVADPTKVLTEASSLAALSRAMQAILTSKYASEPFYESVKKVMLPYTDDFFKHLEVQSVLHQDLEKLWTAEAQARKEREEERARLLAEEQKETLPSTEELTGEAMYSPEELAMPLGKEMSADPTPRSESQQEEFALPFQQLETMPDPEEEKGVIQRMRDKFNSSPLMQQAVEKARNFGAELGQGILQDAKSNARSAVARATNAAVDRGIRQSIGG